MSAPTSRFGREVGSVRPTPMSSTPSPPTPPKPTTASVIVSLLILLAAIATIALFAIPTSSSWVWPTAEILAAAIAAALLIPLKPRA